jgi:hypothetical protein
MGHSSVTITMDRHGHLMPGNEGEAVKLMTAYIEQQRAAATAEAVALHYARAAPGAQA